jgi:hypothetical protein
MALDSLPILQAAESHASATGFFERVNRHEPKNAPGNGLTAALWVQGLQPIAEASGLAATSVLLTLGVRLYTNMLADPQDLIDPNLVQACDALMNAYNSDFTLGALVKNVDIFGKFGESLAARAGYLEQDRKLYRVMTITLPLVINDVWEQSS